MASSSKRQRASSSKQSTVGKPRVIAVRRAEALPRKNSVSATVPPIDEPMESLATTAAPSKKKGRTLQKTEASASRRRRTRAAGGASGKRAVEPEMATALESAPGVEAEMVVEASAIVEETTIDEAPPALLVETVIIPSTDLGHRPVHEEACGALARLSAGSAAPGAPAPTMKGVLVTVASRLLSVLRRWTRVR